MGEKTKVTISLDKEVFNEFRVECEKHGMKLSPRINILLKNSLKEKI